MALYFFDNLLEIFDFFLYNMTLKRTRTSSNVIRCPGPTALQFCLKIFSTQISLEFVATFSHFFINFSQDFQFFPVRFSYLTALQFFMGGFSDICSKNFSFFQIFFFYSITYCVIFFAQHSFTISS